MGTAITEKVLHVASSCLSEALGHSVHESELSKSAPLAAEPGSAERIMPRNSCRSENTMAPRVCVLEDWAGKEALTITVAVVLSQGRMSWSPSRQRKGAIIEEELLRGGSLVDEAVDNVEDFN